MRPNGLLTGGAVVLEAPAAIVHVGIRYVSELELLEIDAAGPEVAGLTNELLASCYGPRFSLTFETTRQKRLEFDRAVSTRKDKLKAEAKGVLTKEQVDSLLEDLDLSKYLDKDGDVDEGKTKAKGVLFFEGKTRGMVLNRTNAQCIAPVS